ncbi:phage head closure protein [Paradevosia shaoguanensis]|uniref:phage head closure protein n=1 Tax=Paradevosia shaoguanensis TaxID=1335043 RepID=UPI0019321130|nr:phage head closure protein [Paradevosia shaoguanensis]
MSEHIPALGTLTDRVQILRREMTGEPEGGHATLFVPIATVWSRVRPLSGRQGVGADGRGVTVSHSVVMRFRPDVKPGDRVVYRGRRLEVVTAGDINGRRAYLSCSCAESAVTG